MTTPPEATMKGPGLLPCPFCGADGETIDPLGWMDAGNNYGPQCLECGATAESHDKWNKRANLVNQAPTPSSSLSAANAAGGMEKVISELQQTASCLRESVARTCGDAREFGGDLSDRIALDRIDECIAIAQSFAERERELMAEVHRRKGSPVDRLHNLCASIERDRDGSEFSKEEWDRIDADNVRLKQENDILVKTLECPEHKHAFDNLQLTKERDRYREALKEIETGEDCTLRELRSIAGEALHPQTKEGEA